MMPAGRIVLLSCVGVDSSHHGFENGLLGFIDACHGVIDSVLGINLGTVRAGIQLPDTAKGDQGRT